ncbi:MAG TPA: hypothetical protein VM848_13630 [Acidimicrobiia bacterium]|nr:hypothetical protein [Acidimicrobiia bacterium]
MRKRTLASLALIAAACTSNPGGTTTTPVISTVPTTTAIQPRWVWGIEEVDLGDGYALGPCEGDADQIACVSKDDSVIGSAEHLPLPMESFEILDGVDDPVGSIELIAIDYVATFLADRQSTCPHLEFRELAPTPVTIGARPGLRYGFEERDGAVVVEKYLIYGVRQEQTIHLFSFSAIAKDACLSNEGELTDPAVLDGLQPGLDQVMAGVESG